MHVDCQRTTNPPPTHPPVSFHFRHVFSSSTDKSIDRSKEMYWILFWGFLVFWDLNETAGQAKDNRGEGRICVHIRNSGTWKELGFEIFERLFIRASSTWVKSDSRYGTRFDGTWFYSKTCDVQRRSKLKTLWKFAKVLWENLTRISNQKSINHGS
jgi:hypothetical protein